MAFMGAKTKHHCTVANNTDVSRLVPLIRKNGKSVWDGCHLFDGYNTTEKIPCPNGWTYDLPEGEATIISEWDLVCDDAYKVSLATSMYFVGVTLGSLVFGTLSDKYGRRPVFLFTMFCPFVLGLFLFFIKNYIAFVVFRFFLGFVLQGLQITAFTSQVEMLSTQYRPSFGIGQGFFWVTGVMSLALVSYLIKDWHYIQLVSTTIFLFQIGFVWCLPESIRWLLINNRFDKAEKVVRNICSFNKITFPRDIFDKTVNKIENKTDIKNFTIVYIFKSSVLRKRSLIMMVVWFSISLGYFGLALNISSLAGNKYLNFFISGALEIIIIALTIFVSNRFGRRKSLSVYFLIGGIALIIAGGLSKSNSVGAGMFWTRFAGIIAPQMLLLGEYTAEAVPFIIFGGMLLLSGALALLLPETLNVKLPETLQDVRKLEMPQEGKGKKSLNAERENIELVS
ncbi:organic cation transporter -like [Paramuricea clavata]|uniref:Organic cation transporter -like n=1 Tax=Paramuricea clavata TaxID=317549 RepID=A0A6S7H2M3_PARCT|nr:organic cation transporter -like [Paramuricea clavata]